MDREKQVLTDFIYQYRDLGCLWDPREVRYTNREARDEAYEALLETYKLIQPDATILDVKRRIDTMRTSYRREHKKVLKSRMTGDDEYVPILWYYKNLEFLNEVLVWNTKDEEMTKVEVKADRRSTCKVVKRRRTAESHQSAAAVYLTENDSLEDEGSDQDQEDEKIDFDQEENVNYNNSNDSEPEVFGKSVGLQLKELDPEQRHIAEKLISDVIFNGRFRRLTVDSCINKLKDIKVGLND